MKTKHEIEKELKLKEERVNYWEKYRSLPELEDLQNLGVI